MKQTILVIEDDRRINKWTCAYLERAGFAVLSALDGWQGLTIAQEQQPDLVVLDLMLPKIDGFTVCSQLRRNCAIPIIMLTAIGDQSSRLKGLDEGADDYMVKPFDPAELIARIHAILRRTQNHVEQVISHSNITINLAKKEVHVSDTKQSLSHTQFEILALFMRHPNQVINRERIIKHLNKDNEEVFDRSIDNHILRLRKSLSMAGTQPIETVYGAGYRFTVEA